MRKVAETFAKSVSERRYFKLNKRLLVFHSLCDKQIAIKYIIGRGSKD
jgi:hypothetical protein